MLEIPTPLSPALLKLTHCHILQLFGFIRKMNSLKDEGTVDPNYLIRFFLDAATGETPHVDASLVARLTDGTIAVFQDINKSLIDRVKESSESQSYSFSLGRSSDRLRLWSDGYGISSGTLDDIFERSSRLRGATLEVLCSIGSTLTESKFGNHYASFKKLFVVASKLIIAVYL